MIRGKQPKRKHLITLCTCPWLNTTTTGCIRTNIRAGTYEILRLAPADVPDGRDRLSRRSANLAEITERSINSPRRSRSSVLATLALASCATSSVYMRFRCPSSRRHRRECKTRFKTSRELACARDSGCAP